MIRFRKQDPVRRANPTKTPTRDNWADHKPDLKDDFGSRCGYCDSHDAYRHTYFEVDHFVPKDFLQKFKHYSLTDYKNLVYSCRFCNNAKRAIWPSKRKTIYNNGTTGFVDPCDITYSSHFYRTANGGIMWRTILGKWMFSNAFKFDERQHSIKILWNLSQLDEIIGAMIIVLNKHSPKTKKYKLIKSKIGTFCFEYYKYHDELKKYYDDI